MSSTSIKRIPARQEEVILTDTKGNTLPYLLKYAACPKDDTKTLIVFHGAGVVSQKYANFYDEHWNVVCPLDLYGLEGEGSWFLGEHGDFFVKDLVLKMIDEVKQKTGSTKFYCWGSSMGGYAAILYGILIGAEAVYANVPFIKLRNCEMDYSKFKKYFDYIFSDYTGHLLDLTKLINRKLSNIPTFFLTNTRFHEYSQLQEQIFYFTDKLESIGVNYYLEITPQKGHIVLKSIAKVVELFTEFEETIGLRLTNEEIRRRNKILYGEEFYYEEDTAVELLFSIQCDEFCGNGQLLYTLQADIDDESYFLVNGFAYSKSLQKYYKYIKLDPDKQNDVTIVLQCPSRTKINLIVQEWYCKGKIVITDMAKIEKNNVVLLFNMD